MAKVIFNQLLETVRGRINKLVLRQRPDGAIIMSGAPSYDKGTGSQKQKAHRQRVKDAAQYAKWADDVYPIYAELAKGSDKWLSAYNFAFADWFEPPVIHRVEQEEGRVLVEASDNVMVAKVVVSVLDEWGTVLDKGEAIRGEGNWWQFASHTKAKKVVVEARDLAENLTRLVV